MALTLTCDGCGISISLEELKSGAVLEHQGAHYCALCKGPILALLKRQSAGKSGAPRAAEAPAATSSAATSSPATSSRVPPPAPRAPTARVKPPSAPPPVAARKAGAEGPRAPERLPADLEEATDLDSELADLARRPSPGHGSAQKPPAAPRAAPAPQATPAPHRPRPVGVRPGNIQNSGIRPSAPAARPSAAAPGEPAEAPTRRQVMRKRVLLFGGGAAGLLVVTLIAVLALRGGSATDGAPSTVQGAPEAPASAGEAERVAREKAVEEGRGSLERFRQRLSEDPEQLLALRHDLELYYPADGLEQSFKDLQGEVERRVSTRASRSFQELLKKSQDLQKQENFVAASQVWEIMPEIVRMSEFRAKWIEEEEKARRQARAWATWAKLDEKADKYLGQDDADIAIAILECEDNYPASCATLYPRIWEKRDERLRAIRFSSETERLARVQREIERQRQENEKERVRRDRERQEKWSELFQKTPWMSLISKDGTDLENWTHRPIIFGEGEDHKVPWSVQHSGNHAILTSDNSASDSPVEIGMNGNCWLDWVLEFEAQVDAGKLTLRTRTQIGGRIYLTQITNETGDGFEMASEKFGAWKKVKVEARGGQVTIYENEAKTMEMEAPEVGGFAFVLGPKSNARIRDAQLKLIAVETREKCEGEDDDDE